VPRQNALHHYYCACTFITQSKEEFDNHIKETMNTPVLKALVPAVPLLTKRKRN